MNSTPAPTLELNESQKAVLQKYLIEGETTWEQVSYRVADFVASAEATPELQATWRDKFLSILLPMKFVPGGSILANSNHGTRGMLNCFVLNAEDNIHDITKLVSDAVLTTKFRGGVGINIGAEGEKGYIRPKGAPFRDGKALGPCSVLDMVSENAKKITTGNKARRGAFLFSMNWRHPDIWEFIQAKTQSTIDANFVKGIIEQMAQLSLSDASAQEKQAALNTLQNELGSAWVETHLSPEGKRDRRWHNANISVQLDDEFFEKLDAGDANANRLWDTVAQMAHDTADPGLLLVDNAKRSSPIRDFITCTNPCVTGDTWVMTYEGARQVQDLIGIQHDSLMDGIGYTTTEQGFWKTGDKEVYQLRTKEGYSLKLTANHKLKSFETNDWIEAKDLTPGDKLCLNNHRDFSFWKGAGTFTNGQIQAGEELTQKRIKQIEKSSYEFYQGFLRAVFDKHGNVFSSKPNEPCGVFLHSKDECLLKLTQRMLLRMGIVSRIFEYKTYSELVITDNNVLGFSGQIGFGITQKHELLDSIEEYKAARTSEKFAATVESISFVGVEPVYDCTVPEVGCFDANGFIAHNCGEIWLPPNSACNLGSLVLTKFVQDVGEGELEIDWKDLGETVNIAVRFLDNVLDVSEFATPAQQENVTNVFRQLGLGIMGWADYLKMARIPYDSQAHLNAIDTWGAEISIRAYKASESLAKEKGACGVWEKIKDVRTGNFFECWKTEKGFFYSGKDSIARSDVTQIERRNSTVLSIAPTGSIAQLAGCSWAFEPDFGLTVWKQVFVDASQNKQNWVQILNPYLESLDLSEADANIVKKTGSLANTEYAKQNPQVAAAFKIAREVPPGWHILVQAKWQEYLDSSVSKTINLPAHATVEDIKNIYRMAEKVGLKGVTIYRSGTLESEPIKVGDNERTD